MDANLVFEDCYGNVDTIVLAAKEATFFQVVKVKVGSGSKLYQAYTL